jgi:Fe/S biogenesis protein NfuA
MSDPKSAQPSVTITEPALERITEVLAAQGDKVAGIRLAVAGRGPDGLVHGFTLVVKGAEPADDPKIEVGGITTYIEARSVEYLDGVTVDFAAQEGGAGQFMFDNPNPVWRDEIALKVQQLLDEAINPQIASHGGVVHLIAIEETRAYVEMGGGCQGCGMADVTLKQGVEVAIKEYVPEIEEVVDTTDHASGTNPYYQPSKK